MAGYLGALLRQCCRRKIDAVLLGYDPRAVLDVRFDEVDDGEVVFETQVDAASSGGVFCVAFKLGDRCRAFVTVLEAVERPADAPVRLHMRTPRETTVADTRAHTRLPVAPEAGLAVEMIAPRTLGPPLAVDLSPGGMQVQFRPPHDPKLTPSDRFRASLTLGAERVDLNCLVRWCRSGAYGVSFDEPPGPTGIEERARLRTLFGQLDAFWIRQRAPSRRARFNYK